MGIPVAMVEAKKREILARQANKNERDKIAATIDSTVNQVNGNYQFRWCSTGAFLKFLWIFSTLIFQPLNFGFVIEIWCRLKNDY